MTKAGKIIVYMGIVLLIPIAILIFFLLSFTWLFEGENVDRGSITYYAGVPAYIRSIPFFEECIAPTYRWRGRDGESVPFIEITYGSGGSALEISRYYRNFLAQRSCVVEPDAELGQKTFISFTCQDPNIMSTTLRIGQETPCRTVKLGFIENY